MPNPGFKNAMDYLEASINARDRLYADLCKEYVYATECNLATLYRMCGLKKTSQYEIKRQTNICKKMLRVCANFASTDKGQVGEMMIEARINHRAAKPATTDKKPEPTFEELLEAALDSHVKELRKNDH